MGCGAGQRHHVVYVASKPGDNASEASSAPARPRHSPLGKTAAKPDVLHDLEGKKALVISLRSSGLQACRRLGAELESLLQEASAGRGDADRRPVAAPRSPETLLEWDARLDGPQQTPYEGGVFQLALWFSETYPFKPPRAEFITPCYHPNVSERGKICLNILKEEWSPMLTVSSVLLCISALLSQPNPEDPLNNDAADAFLRNPAEFERTARVWTKRYAMHRLPSSPGGADTGSGVGADHTSISALGGRSRRPGFAPGDDVALDPMATYQTLNGRVLDEDDILDTVLRASALQPHAAKSSDGTARIESVQGRVGRHR